MKIKNVSLETVCGITSRLPENSLPEIALRENPTWGNRLLSMR